MDAPCAGLLIRALELYAAAGVAFALPFLAKGVERIDPGARGATAGFRLAILFGVVIFWPWLAWRWLAGHREPPEPCDAQRRAAAGSSE